MEFVSDSIELKEGMLLWHIAFNLGANARVSDTQTVPLFDCMMGTGPQAAAALGQRIGGFSFASRLVVWVDRPATFDVEIYERLLPGDANILVETVGSAASPSGRRLAIFERAVFSPYLFVDVLDTSAGASALQMHVSVRTFNRGV